MVLAFSTRSAIVSMFRSDAAQVNKLTDSCSAASLTKECINAPSIFHGAWRLIASVIDERTQAKFCILKDRCTQALASVLGSPLAVEKVRQAVVSPRVTELNATGAWCNACRYTVPAADLCARRLLWTFEVEDGLPLDFEISC